MSKSLRIAIALIIIAAVVVGIFRYSRGRSVSKVPKLALEYYQQGVDSLSSGRIESALSLFFKASDLDPEFAMAHAKVGEAYFRAAQAHKARNDMKMMQNMLQQSEIYANKALAADAKDGNGNFVLGLIAWENGNKEEGLRQLEIASNKGFSSFDFHSMLGFVYNDRAEVTKCIEQYLKANDLKPGDKNTMYNLAELYFGIGNYKKSADFYAEIVKTDNSFEIKASYAAAVWKSGDDQRGKELFNQILESSKGKEFRAYNDIAWILIDKDVDYEWGIKLAQAANDQKPGNLESNDILGWGYFKNKDYENAVKYLNISMKRQPSDEVRKRLDMAKAELEKSKKK